MKYRTVSKYHLMMLLRTILACVCVQNVYTMDPTTKDLLTPIKQYGEGCGYEICRKPIEGMINVHIVPHSHAELGYTRTFHDHFTGDDEFYDKSNINMKRILDATITELWSDKERTFTLSGSEIPYFFHWWSKRDGTVHRMVYQLLRQGRLIFVGGGWGMTDEASTSYQGIIDQFTYSLRKLNASFLDCGRPLVAWQADNFGHSREVTSLLAQMGFDAVFINPISIDDELDRMKKKSLEFLWRGSDDIGRESDLFTHKLFDGYWSPPGFCFGSLCGDPLIITSDTLFKNVDERATAFLEAVISRQAPYYGTQHIMVLMGKRFGYHDAQLWFTNIDKLINIVNMKSYSTTAGIHLKYSTPVCYLKAVHASNDWVSGPPTRITQTTMDFTMLHWLVLDTKQDDFFPFAYDRVTHAVGMYTSRPTVKYMVREGNLYLQMAKQLQVLARLGNNDKLFEELNWIMGVFQDHNVISGAMRIYVKNYYSKKMYNAVQMSTTLLRQAFNETVKRLLIGTKFLTAGLEGIGILLRDRTEKNVIVKRKLRKSRTKVYYRCSFNVSSCDVLVAARSSITIYNPLAWPVTIPVRLPVKKEDYVVYDPKGEVVKTVMMRIPATVLSIPERKSATDHELVFIAADLPPLGLRSYLIEKVKKRVKKSLIKKLKKNRQSKYYIRQTNSYPIDNKTFFVNDEDYAYYDETTTDRVGNMQVGNIPKKNTNNKDFDYVLTPKPRKMAIFTTTNDYDDVTESIRPFVTVEKTTENYGFVADRKVLESNFTAYDTSTERIMNQPTRTSTLATEATIRYTETTTVETKSDVQSTTTEKVDEANDTENENTIDAKFDESNNNQDVPNEDLRKYVHYYEEPNDQFIENKYIRISLDNSTHKVASVVLSNGVNTSLDIQFYYYASDDPVKMETPEKKPPGAYIFRAMDINPDPIIDYVDTKVYKSDIVSEIHCKYSNYASFVLKLYKDSPVIEVDWLTGPIPVKDDLGKDIFIRYMTNLVNEGVFYTDANGRQTIKRIRHMRASYEPSNLDPIAANIYPVTSRIYIEDLSKNIRLSIFNDRSQGGTSLYDGMIDLIVHRRILTDDSGIQSYLNETIDGEGIVVRGKHYLYLTKANFKPNKVFEKKFAKEIELMPQIFANRDNIPEKDKWLEKNNEIFTLKNKLPIGVHILTLEKWNDDTILIRLENYLEKIDVVKHGIKKVFLKDLFINITVKKVKETTLAANIWLENWTPLQWNTTTPFFRNFNEYYGNVNKEEYSKEEELKPVEEVILDDGITLTPQQIRTFVVWYNYIGD